MCTKNINCTTRFVLNHRLLLNNLNLNQSSVRFFEKQILCVCVSFGKFINFVQPKTVLKFTVGLLFSLVSPSSIPLCKDIDFSVSVKSSEDGRNHLSNGLGLDKIQSLLIRLIYEMASPGDGKVLATFPSFLLSFHSLIFLLSFICFFLFIFLWGVLFFPALFLSFFFNLSLFLTFSLSFCFFFTLFPTFFLSFF